MKDISFVDDLVENLDGAVRTGIDSVVRIGEPSDDDKYPTIRNISGLLPLLCIHIQKYLNYTVL
jgi:FMN phosphatase YigB (HAD superfamily)